MRYPCLGRINTTYVHEGSNGTVHGSLIQVRIVQNDRRRLAAQLEQYRLDIFTCGRSDNRTDHCATGEVNLAYSLVSDEGVGDGGSIGGLVEDDVQTSGGETSLAEDVAQSPETLW